MPKSSGREIACDPVALGYGPRAAVTAQPLVGVRAGQEKQPEHDEREHPVAAIEGRHVVEEDLPDSDREQREPREPERPKT